MKSKNAQNTVKEIFLDFSAKIIPKKVNLKNFFYSNRTSSVLHDFGGGAKCIQSVISRKKRGKWPFSLQKSNFSLNQENTFCATLYNNLLQKNLKEVLAYLDKNKFPKVCMTRSRFNQVHEAESFLFSWPITKSPC